jgi:hypothetical protein
MSAWKVRNSIRQHGKWRNSIRQHGSKKLHASAWTATSYVLRNTFVVSAFVAQFYVLCNIWNFLTHSDYFIHADVCSFVIWNSINIVFHADVWNFFNMSYFVSMLKKFHVSMDSKKFHMSAWKVNKSLNWIHSYIMIF